MVDELPTLTDDKKAKATALLENRMRVVQEAVDASIAIRYAGALGTWQENEITWHGARTEKSHS